jgi:hypothetical protein
MKQFRGLAGKFGLSPEEILKVKRWIMSFEIVISTLSLTFTRRILALYLSIPVIFYGLLL